MGVNTTQHFKSSENTTADRYAVGTVAGDIFPSDATYLRDVSRLICLNLNSSPRDLTLFWSDGANHDIIEVVAIPGNAGQTVNSPAVDLLFDADYRAPGVTQDAFGNFLLRIPKGKKLRAMASAAASLVILVCIESYQGS